MGWILVTVGSAGGAVIPWLAARSETSRSAALALNGIVCGLLGALASASRGISTPAVDIGLGLLSTAAPLTLCVTGSAAIADRVEIALAVRRFAVTLALALLSGTCCAVLGFVSVESMRDISVKVHEGESLGYPATTSPAPEPTGSPAALGRS